MKPMAPPPASSQGQGDAHLREATVHSRDAFRGHFLHVRQDVVRLPDGSEAGREYIVHPGAVMIVPLLDDGRLVVERQYRYPHHRAFVEFPAGKLDPGEDVFTCAVRELAEETGYRAKEWARAGFLNNAIAYSDEAIEIWFARGLVPGPTRLDAGEFLDVFTTTLDELEAGAARGDITDAKTLIGMLWLTHNRAGRWPLQWQPTPPALAAI